MESSKPSQLRTNDHEEANGEPEQHEIVSLARTEQLLRTDGTPENSSGVKGALVRAGEAEGRVRRTDVGKTHGEIEDGCTDEAVDHSRPHLGPKGVSGGDLEVMGELEVIAEVDCLISGNVAVRLEIHQSVGVTSDERPADEFGEHVEGDRNAGDSLNQTARDHDDQGHDDTENDDDWRSAGRIDADTDHAEDHGSKEHDEIPPFRDLLVILPHQAHVNVFRQIIFLFGGFAPLDGPSDAPPERPESHGDLMSVEEGDVGYGYSKSIQGLERLLRGK